MICKDYYVIIVYELIELEFTSAILFDEIVSGFFNCRVLMKSQVL